MNERIKELALQARLVRVGDFGMKRWKSPRSDSINDQDLEKFAELIAAHEREACAKVAETTVCDVHLPSGTKIYGSRVATAICARGTT